MTQYIPAYCFSTLLTGAGISFLGNSFFRASRKMPRSPRLAHKAPVMQARITLTVFGLLCYCHFVIRQDHAYGFGSLSEPHRLPGWLCA